MFAIVFLAELVSARIPGALIGLMLATLAVVVFGLADRGVAVLGALPNGLPRAGLPLVRLSDIQALVPLALLIAIVVMVQTAATARSSSRNRAKPQTSTAILSALAPAAWLRACSPSFRSMPARRGTAIAAQNGG